MVMATPGGLRFFLLFLVVQVLACAESAPIDKPSHEVNPEPPHQGHHNGSDPADSDEPTPVHVSKEDAVVLIGSDLELSYELYEQITEASDASTTILSLLPTNETRSVSGYAELKDIVQTYGNNTKVILSKEEMVPAVDYLRIVALNPEEVMVQLPDGEVIPNIIFQERLGQETETQDWKGQQYYTKVPESDYHPFVIKHPKNASDHQPTGHEPATETGAPQTE